MKLASAGVNERVLGWMRVGIGALILLRTTPVLAPLDIPWLRSASPLLGWPTGGFGLAFLPNSAIAALCILRTLSALLFTLGIFARPCGILCGVSGFLVAAQYPLGYFFTIHLLYQAAILLACTDAVSQLTLRASRSSAPVGGRWLMRAFVASIYCWAGLYKLRPDWLDGRTLELFHQPTAIRGMFADWLFSSAWLPALVAQFVAGLELSLGPLLLWRRTRPFALCLALAFHAVVEMLAHPDLLGFGMIVLLASFLDDPRLDALDEAPALTSAKARRAQRAA